MSLLEQILLGVALAMDAFAVSICKGLCMKKVKAKNAVIIGLYFGGFQALMPLIGFFLGSTFKDLIESVDHWIAFGLLAMIGGNMIKEALSKDEESSINDSVAFKAMVVLAIATSIDALAAGVTFSFLEVNVWLAVSIIGIISFIFSFCGTYIGNKFGSKYEKKAEFIGGCILCLLGLKILLEHLGILVF